MEGVGDSPERTPNSSCQFYAIGQSGLGSALEPGICPSTNARGTLSRVSKGGESTTLVPGREGIGGHPDGERPPGVTAGNDTAGRHDPISQGNLVGRDQLA